MTLDRSSILVGSQNTVIDVTWDNELKNKINTSVSDMVELETFKNYIRGFKLSYDSPTSISCSPGVCMGVGGTSIESLRTTALSVSNRVLSGLDFGTLTTSMYYVFVVLTIEKEVSLIFSSSLTPSLPAVIDYRLVGAFSYSTSTSSIVPFFQTGVESCRDFIYYAGYSVLSTTTSAAWVTTSASSLVPPVAGGLAHFRVMLNRDASNNAGSASTATMFVRPTTSLGSGSYSTSMNFSPSLPRVGEASVKGIISVSSSGEFQCRYDPVNTNNSIQMNAFITGFRLNL